jgi:type I restriction enzyme S subunit
VPGLNRNDAYPIPVLVPDLAEQARIAEVLDTLDEAIQKTEQILLKRQFAKQGLLHDLLRVGLGENGEIRDIQKAEEFKATEVGLIPSTWVVRSLEQIATNHDGKRIPLKQADRVKRQGPFPYYGASGVIDSIDDYLFDGTYVLLGEDGENVVSRNLPLAFVVTGKFWPNNHAHVYEPQPGIKAGFLVELLETSDFSGIVSGSAQPKLTQEALRRLRFAVPPPPEQELILKLIEASNEALRSEKQQLEKLNQMKSGLAADLLTGRVRVRDGAPA